MKKTPRATKAQFIALINTHGATIKPVGENADKLYSSIPEAISAIVYGGHKYGYGSFVKVYQLTEDGNKRMVAGYPLG